MINNTKKILTEDAVAHTIHFINKTVRAANNQLQAKDCKTDFYVMTGNLVEQVIDSIEYRNAKSALVIGDAGLQIVNRLIQEGITNITLALSRFENKEIEIPGIGTCYLLDEVGYIIKSTFPNIKINIIDFKETAGMKTDLVIANYPYGAIGANLTKKVIDTVDFKEFINLLPANDYKRNTTKDLFNYQSDMIAINNGFEDAAVTTHIAQIHKNKVNNMTLDEFERSNYIDRQLDKYFEENSKRSHYAIDAATQALIFDSGLSNKTTLLIDHRYIPHKHLAFSKKTDEYKWNVLKSITLDDLSKLFAGKVTFRKGTALNKYVVTFKSEQEMSNITKFIYSSFGFRFMSKLATAINVDSTVDINKVLPKVDWTRSWTVEEILTEYGYTQNEIKEVMDDLVNFKGMDD